MIGTVAVAAAERLASHLSNRGYETAAERTRRAGRIVAWVGSLACQLAIETSARGGVGDKWDVVFGVAATAPGIVTGRKLGEHQQGQ